MEDYDTLSLTPLGITAIHYQLLMFYWKHTNKTQQICLTLTCYAQMSLLKTQASACWWYRGKKGTFFFFSPACLVLNLPRSLKSNFLRKSISFRYHRMWCICTARGKSAISSGVTEHLCVCPWQTGKMLPQIMQIIKLVSDHMRQ